MLLKSVNNTDLNKICRLCLYQGFETDFVLIHKNLDLIKKIHECISLQIELSTNLPSGICLSCIRHLNDWASFREVCHQSHRILIETYSPQNNSSVTFQHEHSNDLDVVEKDAVDIKNNLDYTDNDVKDTLQTISNPDFNLNETSSPPVISKRDSKKPTRKRCIRRRAKVKAARYKKHKPPVKKSNVSNSDCEETFFEDTIEELEKYLNKLYQEDAEKEFYNNLKQKHTYECDICSETFSTIFDYLDHQEVHNGQPVFRCQKCEQVFSTRHELVEHDNRHQIPCSKCGKMVLPGSLKTHMVLHTDKYKCLQCNWRFCNSTMLKQHVESVHIRLKTHICETCGKSFTSTTSLQTHIKIHSDVRPYICKICAYSGRTASALYTHMAKHENGLHVCEVCAKSFKSFRSLRDHTRRVHSKNKNHECGFCHKKFVDKYMLTVHTRTHTGARPYECNQCDRAFVRSDGLRDHLATHSQRAIYTCHQCGKKFIYRRSLSRHVCITESTK